MNLYFTDFFGVDPNDLEDYGAFDISLINDLPLFIDPFLLFNSEKPEYHKLHTQIIEYVRFLKECAEKENISPGLLEAWFVFPEIKQNWLGYSRVGNSGAGLGLDFGNALHRNLGTIFSDFGEEQVTKGSHIEKLCLIRDGVGKDNISDFTTNLIKDYLLKYTQDFARINLPPQHRRIVTVKRVKFNYQQEVGRQGNMSCPGTIEIT